MGGGILAKLTQKGFCSNWARQAKDRMQVKVKTQKKRQKGREGRREEGKQGGKGKLFQIAIQTQTILSAVTYLFVEDKFDLLKQPKDIQGQVFKIGRGSS